MEDVYSQNENQKPFKISQKIITFDSQKYNFVKVVTDLFGMPLDNLHNWTNTKYDFFASGINII